MQNKKLTINDIAKMAGTSKTTVSRYINEKYEYMSEETKNRIKQIIETSNYQPSNIARTLKSQKSNMIGLVVADIESPFSSAVIKSVGDALENKNYYTIIGNANNSYEQEQRVIRSMQAQHVDAFIVNTSSMNNPYLIQIANSGIPVVLLDRFVKDYIFDIAYISNNRSMQIAFKHLEDMGYTNISFYTQPYENISPRHLRRLAFIDELNKRNIADSQNHIYIVDNNIKNIKDSINQTLHYSKIKNEIPAIISGNGVTMMLVARAILELGLSMPYEIGLLGYDEWGWASEIGLAGMIDVGITTLCASTHKVGEATVDILLKRINTPEIEKQKKSLLSNLYIKRSTMLKK